MENKRFLNRGKRQHSMSFSLLLTVSLFAAFTVAKADSNRISKSGNAKDLNEALMHAMKSKVHRQSQNQSPAKSEKKSKDSQEGLTRTDRGLSKAHSQSRKKVEQTHTISREKREVKTNASKLSLISWKSNKAHHIKLTKATQKRERKLNLKILDHEYSILQKFNFNRVERQMMVESVLAGDTSRKEFQIAIEGLFESNPDCGLEDLTRNGLLARLVHKWHQKGVLKLESGLQFQRQLMRANSGHDFWDLFEDSYMDWGVTSDLMRAWADFQKKKKGAQRNLMELKNIHIEEGSSQLGRELKRAKGSANLRKILNNLSQKFVSDNFHDEAIRKLKRIGKNSKAEHTPLERMNKDLRNFCKNEKQERRLGKLNFLQFLTTGLSHYLRAKSQSKTPKSRLTHSNLIKSSNEYFQRISNRHLILKTDRAVLLAIIHKINQDDKHLANTTKNSAKQSFIDFIQEEADLTPNDRKLILDTSHRFHATRFVQAVQKKVEKLLKVQDDSGILSRASDFVGQNGHSQNLLKINSGIAKYLKELESLGDLGLSQKNRIRNLVKAVSIDSYILDSEVDTRRFFRDLRQRSRDKTLKNIFEGVLLHSLKQKYSGKHELISILSQNKKFESKVGTKFDSLAESLSKIGLLRSKKELESMRPRVLFDLKANLNDSCGLDPEISNHREVQLVKSSILTHAKTSTNERILKRCKRIFSKKRSEGVLLKAGYLLIIARRFINEFGSEDFSDYEHFKLILHEYIQKLKQEKLIMGEEECLNFFEELRILLTRFLVEGKLDKESFEEDFKGINQQKNADGLRFRLGDLIFSHKGREFKPGEIEEVTQKIVELEKEYDFKLDGLVDQIKSTLPTNSNTTELFQNIEDKIAEMPEEEKIRVVYLIEQLIEVSKSIDFGDSTKLEEFLKSYFDKFQNINQSDRNFLMKQIIQLTVPGIAAIQELTDKEVISTFKDKYKEVTIQMKPEELAYLQKNLGRFIRQMFTSKKLNMSFISQRMRDFQKDFKAFSLLLKQIVRGKQNISEEKKNQMQNIIKRLSDFFKSDRRYGKMFKGLLEASSDRDKMTKEQLRSIDSAWKDLAREKGDVAYLLKTIAQLNSKPISGQSLSSIMMALETSKDEFLEANPKLAPIFKGLMAIQKPNFSMSQIEIKNLRKAIKDLNISIGGGYAYLLKAIATYEDEQNEAHSNNLRSALQRMKDEFIGHEGIAFLIKGEASFMSSIESLESGGTLSVLSQLADELIEVSPQLVFMIKGVLRAEMEPEKMTKEEMDQVIQSVKDLKINISTKSILLRAMGNLKSKFSQAAQQDLQMALSKFKDELIEFINEGFFLGSKGGIKTDLEALKSMDLETALKKLQDYLIDTHPKFSLLIKNLLSLAKGSEAITSDSIQIINKRLNDLGYSLKGKDMLLKSLLSAKGIPISGKEFQSFKAALSSIKDELISLVHEGFFLSSKSSIKTDLEALKSMDLETALQKLQDYLINTHPKFSLLIKNLLSMAKGLEVITSDNIQIINERLNDLGYNLKGKDMLLKSLLSAKGTPVSGKEFQTFKAALSSIKDELIDLVHEGVLISSEASIKGKIQIESSEGLKNTLEKLADALVEVKPHLSFLLKNLSRIQKNTIVIDKDSLKIISEKIKDSEIDIEKEGAFLMKSLTEASERENAAERQGIVKSALVKFRDFIIDVGIKQDFLLKSDFMSRENIKIQYNENLRATLKRLDDHLIEVEPEFTFLIKSLLEVQKSPQVITKKFLKVISKKMLDMQINPESIGFMIKGLLSFKETDSKANTETLKIAFKRVKDELVLIQREDLLLKLYATTKSKLSARLMNEFKIRLGEIKDLLFFPDRPGTLFKSGSKMNLQLDLDEQQRMKTELQKIRDFEVEHPEFGFLMKVMANLPGELRLEDVATLTASLRKMMDFHVKPGNYLNFLLQMTIRIGRLMNAKNITEFKTFLKETRDFVIHLQQHGFLLKSCVRMTEANISIEQHTKLEEFSIKLRDFLIIIEGHNFMLKSLMKISENVTIKHELLFQNFLKKMRDFLIHGRHMNFLLKFLGEVGKRQSVKTKSFVSISLSRLRDYLILTSGYSFLLKSGETMIGSAQKSTIMRFISFWKTFRDFFISPETLKSFLIKKLLFFTKKNQLKKVLKFKIVRKIFKDFPDLLDRSTRLFLIRSMIKFFAPFKFGTISKFKMVLRKFVDALIVPKTSKDFLMKAVMSMYQPEGDVITLRTNFFCNKTLDHMIQVKNMKNFLLKSELSGSRIVRIKKMRKVKLSWMGMKDYLVSPLSLKDFLIMSVFLTPENPQAKKILKIQNFAQKLRDFHNLVQTDFGTFFLSTFVKFFGELQFRSQHKFTFLLKRFLDNLVLTRHEKDFLLKNLLTLSRKGIRSSKKLKFSAFFRNMKDYLITVQGKNFMLKSGNWLQGKFSIQAHKIRKLTSFWIKLKDFFVSPMKLDQFLLKQAFLTSSSLQLEQFKNMTFLGKKFKDFENLIDPSFRKFFLKGLLNISRGMKFSNTQKLKFFLHKVVDALIIPKNEKLFLMKCLASLISDQSIGKESQFKFKFTFKKTLDALTEPERQNLFLIKSGISSTFKNSVKSLKRLRVRLESFKDFFILPFSTKEFVLFSLFNMRRKLDQKEISRFKTQLVNFQDFEILVSREFRMFFMKSLMTLFEDLKFSSTEKLTFALKRFVDNFNFVDSEKHFLLKLLIHWLKPEFIAFSKLRMKQVSKYLRDFQVHVRPEREYELELRGKLNESYMLKSTQQMKTFFTRMQDFFVSPENLNIFLLKSCLQGQADFVMQNFSSFRTKFSQIKDFEIFPEQYFAFVLKSLTKASTNLRFYSIKKLRIFLKRTLDFLNIPHITNKFIIKMLLGYGLRNFESSHELVLKGIFARFMDHYIEIHGNNFLLTNRYAMKSNLEIQRFDRFKTRLQRLKDFFISPEDMKNYYLRLLFKQDKRLNTFSKLIPKLSLRMTMDFPFIASPNKIIAFLLILTRLVPNFEIKSFDQLKFMFSRFFDYFVPVEGDFNFLLSTLTSFYKRELVKKQVKLKTFLFKFADFYFPITPELLFLKLRSRMRAKLQTLKTLKLGVRFSQVQDFKIEIENLIKAFINSVFKTSGISAVQKYRKIKALWRKSQDYYHHIELEHLYMKMLSFDLSGGKEIRKIKKFKTIDKKMRDFFYQPAKANMFLLKMMMKYYGDMQYRNSDELKFFLKKYVDKFSEVFIKNTKNFYQQEFGNGSYLHHGFFNFKKAFGKFKTKFTKQDVLGVSIGMEAIKKLKLLKILHLQTKSKISASKLKMLKKQIKDLNLNTVLNLRSKQIATLQKVIEKRLFAQRLKFHKDKFGMNLFDTNFIRAPYAAMKHVRTHYLVGSEKIKVFVKAYHNEIKMHMSSQQKIKIAGGHGVVKLGRTKFKMAPLPVDVEIEHLDWRKVDSKGALVTNKKHIADGFGKTKIKTRFGPQYKKSFKNVDDLGVFYTKVRKAESDLYKLKMKALSYTVMKSRGEQKKLRQIKEKMRFIDSFLNKRILKKLEFVIDPKYPKQNGLKAVKIAVVNRLKGLTKKLQRVGKVLLKSVGLVRRPDDVHFRKTTTRSIVKKIFQGLKKFKNFGNFKKVVLLAGTSGGNKKKDAPIEKIKIAYKKSKQLMTGRRFEQNYNDLKKILLLEGTRGGNKKTDRPVEKRSFVGTGEDHLQMMRQNAHKILKLTKILLLEGTRGGNKKVSKETLYRNFVGKLIRRSNIDKNTKLSFSEFKKIYIKFYKGVSAPNYFRTELKKIRDWFQMGMVEHSLKDFRKILLLRGTTPGNKRTPKETWRFAVNVEKDIKDRLNSMQKKIEETSKVLLKTEKNCCCCCEFLVSECCSDEEHEIETQEEELYHETEAYFDDERLVDQDGRPIEDQGGAISFGGKLNGVQEQDIQKEREKLRAISRGDYCDMARYSEKQVFQILNLDPKDPRGWGWEEIESPGHLYLQHQAQERLRRIEDFEFDCRTRPQHKIYNILPDVTFDLSYKSSSRSRYQREKELTTVKDVEPIIDEDQMGLEKMYSRTNRDFENGKITSLDAPEFKNHREFYKPVNLEGDSPVEKLLMREIEGSRPDYESMVREGPFMGKDFHEEHHQTRNQRIPSYSIRRDGNTIDMRV